MKTLLIRLALVIAAILALLAAAGCGDPATSQGMVMGSQAMTNHVWLITTWDGDRLIGTNYWHSGSGYIEVWTQDGRKVTLWNMARVEQVRLPEPPPNVRIIE